MWLNVKGIVCFQLLPRNQTINLDVYCRRLDKLNNAIKKRPELVNRRGVVYRHDNAKRHTSLVEVVAIWMGCAALPKY